MKKLLFALVAGVLANCLVWLLQYALRYFVTGMAPMVGVWVVLVGLPLVVAGFLVGMIRLGKDARLLGFEGYSPAFLFAAGFFCMFIRSFFVDKSTIDFLVHDTYFVIANGHAAKGVAFLSGLFALVYFFYQRVLRRPLHRGLGYWHFWLTVVGIFLFFNASVLFSDVKYHDIFIEWDRVATMALMLLAPGQVVFLVNLAYSVARGNRLKNG